jgi:predicted RNA-binding Zn-ribbon protein involved in translation (DUF1610 family)
MTVPPLPPSGPPPLPGQAPDGARRAPVPPPLPPRPQAPQRPPGPPLPQAQDERAMFHVTEQTRTYPCPNCGDSLVYDPASHQLRSPSCGGLFPIMVDVGQPVAKHDLDSTVAALRAELATRGGQQSTEKEVVCQSCGGRTLFSGTLTAVRCPYCNTPIQRDDVQTSPVRLPIDGIVPLQISQPQARDLIEKWINGRWFAPREFKKYRVLGSFSSVYLSYYGYDADVTTQYTGERGITRVERDDDGNTRTYTDWWPASGVVFDQIRSLTESANTGLDAPKVRQLEPWPTDAAVSYHPEFVAGHLARTYDGDAEQVFTAQAKPRIESIVTNTVRRDIGGDEQRISFLSSQYANLMFMYLMMPVWLLTVTYAGKPFQVYVNGITGEVQGRRPWSAIKIAFAVIAALIVIGIVLYLYGAHRGGGHVSGGGSYHHGHSGGY